MGTISDKLMRIINTKEDIRQALISKGYDVPTSIPFKEYAKMILDLPCNADSFPDIEGIVARYSASDLTNEQMATNPVWVDKTGNGHDIQLKNFSWKGMSGVGGYVGDFSKWVNNRDTTEIGITKSNSKVIIDVKVSQGSGKNIVFISKSNLGISNNVTIKITSTYPEGVMKFANSASNKYLKLPSNGIITLQDNPEYTSNEMHLHLASADLGQITIEQLPLYPGALVFDGVDDYGVCENFPILTKKKGYTVVALRQWLSFQDIGYPTLVVNSTDRLAAFSFEDFISKTKSTWNWGRSVGLSDYKIPLLYTYQTSTSYNSKTIYAGATEEGSNILQVCRSGIYCANAAIWEIVILDHDATEEELTKIKDYFVKTYPWLFPDQAWTVTGKTNEDEDRATIANITGNGNDLVLSNFGFAEGSGYGLYYQYFGNEFKTTNGEIEGGGWNIIDNYNISHDKRIPINSVGKCLWGNKALVNGIKLRFKLTGMTEGDVLAFGYAATYDLTYTSDGIYAIDLPPVDKPYGFSLQSSLTENLPTTPVTIELLPFEYEGYLVTDGVDDRVVSSSFTLNKDWTIVGNWKMLQPEANKLSGIVKQNSLFIYNHVDGLNISINDAWNFFKLKDIRSVNAICSDGRIYLNDWTEIIDSKQQTVNESVGTLVIGILGNVYTSLAFKNLSFYNNQNLSKDDCIKAYNYLQTLKAK
jgi:hypothetical protein